VGGYKQSLGASSDSSRVSVSHRSDVLITNSHKGHSESGSSKTTLPCIFCKGGYFIDKCDKYTSLSKRKQRLSQQK